MTTQTTSTPRSSSESCNTMGGEKAKEVTAKAFPDGFFLGRYKGVSMFTKLGNIQCLFGWIPREFASIRAAKYNITRWQNAG